MSGTNRESRISNSDADCEPKGKRARGITPSHLEYINKVDGKGYYLRFSMSAPYIEDCNLVLVCLYKDQIIDASYAHVYNRPPSDRTSDEKRVVLHAIVHVVSRDYDFNFWRNRLPQARFRISTYPDDSYSKLVVREDKEGAKVQNNSG